MNHFTLTPHSHATADDVLDWRPEIERLRRELDGALSGGDYDHLAIAEAECWIDLIDAELTARRQSGGPTVTQLAAWRAELEAMLRHTKAKTVDVDARSYSYARRHDENTGHAAP